MEKIAVAVLVGLALGSIGVANAAGYKNTVSIGYAYTDLSGWLSGNANGANIKYNCCHYMGQDVSRFFRGQDVLRP